MAYLMPGRVAGGKNWEVYRVLFDGGEGEFSYALGYWKKKLCLGIRWNGDEESRGFPKDKDGKPLWFIMDDDHQRVKTVLGMLEVERRHRKGKEDGS